jgi:hypothetical protein
MSNTDSGAAAVDERIAALDGWRAATLRKLRDLIKAADPEVVESVKWRKPSSPLGVPVWEHAGLICTGETYKDKVKLTFAQGAALDDPAQLFNASMEGNTRRAIDVPEHAEINEDAFKTLIRDAVALNVARKA